MSLLDSRNPTRRALLLALLGTRRRLRACVAAHVTRGARRVRSLARRIPHTRPVARHLRTNFRPGDGPHRARYERVQGNPQPAGIPRAALAVHQPPCLRVAARRRQRRAEAERRVVLAHRARLRRRAWHHAGAVGRGVDVRRSPGAEEPHAPDLSVARGAGVERAAPPRLLGRRTHQRAAHRRARLGESAGNERLVGRRHGSHPMDARGLAQHGLRL